MNLRFFIVYIGVFLYSYSSLHGSSFTYALSDFTSGLDGWGGGADGAISTIDAINTGDPYMRKEIDLDGGGGYKARMVVRRPTDPAIIASDPWLGDFISKGIQRVELDFKNSSESDTVFLRLAISNVANPQISTGTWWVSKTYYNLSPEGQWEHVSFNLVESEMQPVGTVNSDTPGTDSFEETLSNVRGFRFISNGNGYSAIGAEYSGVIGMDNIELIAIPEPSATITVFAFIIGITLFFRRRT